MKSLPPIPTPLALRWREFRIKFFPGVIVLAALLACVVIWVRHVTPPTLVGQVEAVRANVSSSKPGTLTQLQVTLLKKVHALDPVAVIITTDPKVLESSLAVIRAEVALIRAGLDPLAGKERNELDYERLRLDCLDQRVQLATARVQLHYAEAEFERIANLFQSQTNIVSRAQYDLALRDRDVAQTAVEGRAKLVSDSEQGLERLRLADSARAPTRPDDTIRAAIAVQEERLRLTEAQLSPITLTSPIDGIVSMVYRRSGENIVAGEPLVTITATQPEKIIAYLPQPLPIEPEVGMQVRVSTRSLRRASGLSKVQEVGQYLEPIPPVFLPPLARQVVQLGLPVHVAVPGSLTKKLRVGELVNLNFL
jgi:multidrug resistance efflux pump